MIKAATSTIAALTLNVSLAVRTEMINVVTVPPLHLFPLNVMLYYAKKERPTSVTTHAMGCIHAWDSKV